MKHRKNMRSIRLERIERKCDLILSEIIIIRQQLHRKSDIDTVIDRLHKSARNMRVQCNRQRDKIIRMFGPQK